MSHRTFIRRLALALLAGVATAGQGLALEPSGTTVDVDPDAAASGATGARILEVRGPVYMGDEIKTDRRGQAQILFVDETKFVVGPNSKVVIDSFVFDPSKTAQDVRISAVKGAFRFITGASPKNAYSIRTPTMTIGVRGTAFDLAVRGGGESMIALHEGEATVCDARRTCMDLPEGSFVVAEPGGGFQSLPIGQLRRQRIQAHFPLIQRQVGLAPAFQVSSPISAGLSDSSGAGTQTAGSDHASDPGARSQPPRPEPRGRPPDGRPP